MTKNLISKLLLFFFGIEFVVFGLWFKIIALFFVWIINLFIILFIFFDIDLKSLFGKFKNINVDKSNINIFDKIKWYDFSWVNYILESIRFFYLKWWFVFAIVLLILSLLDYFVFKKFNLSLWWSFSFFILWLVLSYKKLKNWELFIWKRLINWKDIVFILSLLVAVLVFTYLDKFQIYEKVFYSLLFGFIFYVFTIYSFGYTKDKLIFFRSFSVLLYLLFLFLSFLSFLWYKIPEIKKSLTVEKIVYKTKVIEKPILANKKNDLDNLITYVAPNGKIYEIFVTSTWAYFTWYNGKVKIFKNLDEAEKVIYEANSVNDKEKESIWNVFSKLLNNDNKDDKIITYADIIPYLVKKYKLSTNNKKDVEFTYISKKDPNYDLFKIAYYNYLFWRKTNPKKIVKCKNFAVLLGLAQKWKVNYNRYNVYDKYWEKAVKKWYKFNICCKSKNDVLTFWKKTCILK